MFCESNDCSILVCRVLRELKGVWWMLTQLRQRGRMVFLLQAIKIIPMLAIKKKWRNLVDILCCGNIRKTTPKARLSCDILFSHMAKLPLLDLIQNPPYFPL